VPEMEFLEDQVEAISLVATWLNAREGLDPARDFEPNDFKVVAFGMTMSNWTAEVICSFIGDTVFKVTYDGILQEFNVAQFRRVDSMSITKASLQEKL